MTPPLQGSQVRLRALEPEDIDQLMAWENDESNWPLSGTLAPYSRQLLRQYIQHSDADIYQARQLRLMIEERSSQRTIGTIDLFDFDPKNLRAGVGILIGAPEDRSHGWGQGAVQLIIHYSFYHLHLQQLYCTIGANNPSSHRLFTKMGFEQNGIQKRWIRRKNSYEDAFFYQLLAPEI